MKRITLIDGLRGIAALSVLVFHFDTRLDLPGVAGWIARQGYLGVALFFVLSGFVITMSVGDRTISGSFLGRFALRREVRLALPYWMSGAMLILIGLFGARFGASQPVPTVGSTLAHLVYLQDLLGLTPISTVYWSLCLEVQFYLFLVLGLWLMQRDEPLSDRVGTLGFQSVVFATLALSLACRKLELATGSFIPMWYCFALGATAYWTHAGWLNRGYAWVAVAFVLVVGWNDPWSIATSVSAGGILAASQWGKMGTLANPVSQFFGRISYSLYLTHNIFGWYAMQVALKFTGPWVAASFGIAVAVSSAWVWYWVLERPSVILSRRVPMVRAEELSQNGALVDDPPLELGEGP